MAEVPVLVLNASYEPINVTPARRAILLILKGRAVCEEASGLHLSATSSQFPLPDVIRLKHYVKLPIARKVFSKRHILMRDNFTCQYCLNLLPASHLTIDHVVPKSRGGLFTWNNVVACCRTCNHTKGDRTPEEAGMPLRKAPKAPGIHLHFLHVRHMGAQRENWKKYLYF